MSEFFKSKGRLAMVLSGLFLAITVIAGAVAYLIMDDTLFVSPSDESGISQEEGQLSLEEQGGEPHPEVTDVFANVEEPEVEAVDDGPVHYNTPGEMRGVFLSPGIDYQVSSGATQATITGEIDAALQSAKDLGMNTVIINTGYESGVIYRTTNAPSLYGDFDIMEAVVARCRDLGLYTYAIFDASLYGENLITSTLSIGTGSINRLSSNLREFAEKYQLDGILIDGYIYQAEDVSYHQYLSAGGGIGFANYMRQTPSAVVKTASKTIRAYARGTQVGLLADAVWENAADNEVGSNTTATFTSLGSGNADTKGYVEENLVDFVAVKAYSNLTSTAEPFKEVVAWWSSVANENGVPLYVVHASDKICTEETGWEAHDQITKQVIEASGYSGYRGSVFNNLSRLVEDPKEATTTLVKYYNNEVEAAHILTELEITKPDQTTFTTFEPVVTFTGASDPNSPVTINGEEVPTDASGYFTITFDLEAGLNAYKIEHKEKVLNYQITRQVQILKDISPMGSIATEGGMSITISATAYSDAQVYATVNGQTVNMSIDDSVELEENRDSTYKQFSGEYVAPAATTSEQSLGNIVVYASWQGETDTMQGASIKVNKKAQIEDGVPVVITASQASTYPPNTLNNIPSPSYYPLPAGAMDYAVGDEIVYKKGSETFTYYVLASDLRVETKDLSASSDFASGNVVSGLSVSSESGYTYVTLNTSQKVSYSFQYTDSAVSITLHYTNSVPDNLTLSQNPLFTAATWKDTTLTLSLTKSGGFMGYKGYYDDSGNLVLRFNNPPSSISNARIAIDPGHGGRDSGALGFLADYPEKVINLAIAQKLADELESRGATVLLLNTSGGMELAERVRQAEQFNADIFVSVHNNTAANSSATGTEVYYFYPFSRTLAATASQNVAGQFGTTNRGARQSYYHVTLSSQFTSILAECGFLTNKDEYEKLIKSGNQSNIANALADSIAAYIKSVYPGSGGGSESTGSLFNRAAEEDARSGETETIGGSNQASGSSQSSSGSSGASGSGSAYFTKDSIVLTTGRSYTLTIESGSGEMDASDFLWESDDTSVATVDKNGKVTGLKEGTTYIFATSKDDEKDLTCKVTVNSSSGDSIDVGSGSRSGGSSDIEVNGMDLSEYSLSLEVGDTHNLEVIVRPVDASQSVTWKSSNTSVATVDANGKVTALRSGTATITVTSKSDSYIYEECEVEVD